MKQLIIYIHGMGGSAAEAEHYKPLFPGSDVTGFDYASQTPWEAAEEFPAYFDRITADYDEVILIANSFGAYLSLNSLSEKRIAKAFFISPVVDMERLIMDMMAQEGITEETLRIRQEITTSSGTTLSWQYLTYVRERPTDWQIPTAVLCGSDDCIVPRETAESFAKKAGASLTVMEGGEHWFHTPEQMAFLDKWIEHETKGEDSELL